MKTPLKKRVQKIVFYVIGCVILALAFASAPEPRLLEKSITAADLKQLVEWLASDLLAGRATGSKEIVQAEEYIESIFKKSGLAAIPGANDYFLDFALYQIGFDPNRTHFLALDNGEVLSPKFSRDFVPVSVSGYGLAIGEAVFAGYGISAPAQSYDDYEGLDIAGKIVLVFRHEPDSLNITDSKGRNQYSHHSFFKTKIENAYAHGASGIIILTDPRYRISHDNDLTSLSIYSLSPDNPEDDIFHDHSAFEEGKIPAVLISTETGAKIMSSAGIPPEEVQQALDGGAKANSFQLANVQALINVRPYSPSRLVGGRNVAGFLPGSDPGLRDEWIVVTAHHDHIGSFFGDGDTIYNGADDNASGTSGVLELAEAFARHSPRPRHSILFMTLSAEEEGLLGARAVFEQKLFPVEKIKYECNLDMIGRNPDRPLEIIQRARVDGFSDEVEEFVKTQPLYLKTVYAGKNETYSDDLIFARYGISSFFFFSGLHPDYHGVDDEADRLDYAAMETRVRFIYDFILFLDKR